ncbi:MAG TPA: cytidylate kinase family protein, partial [Aquabacterium sp.]|nr:cytidylate kinase family protein [Aquabacterium sp.]
MPVIALTQEMGSLAKDVAERVAQAAGLAVMRNEVMENVAERMHVPPSLVRRVREGKAGLVERLTT